MATPTEIVNKVLGDTERSCVWQVCPDELPEDMPGMAMELWMDSDGLHLFQFFLEIGTSRKRGADWYNHISGFEHFTPERGIG